MGLFIFNSASKLTFEFNSTGYNCDLINYTVAFDGAPSETTVSSNSPDLSIENAKILPANLPVAAGTVTITITIFSSSASQPYLIPKGRMAFTFSYGYFTYCVTWDILIEPRPEPGFDECSWSADADDYTDLAAFAAGETIDIAL